MSRHDEVGAVGTEPQLDIDAGGAAVLERVGQRLEADAQQMMLLRGIETLPRAGHPHVRFGPAC